MYNKLIQESIRQQDLFKTMQFEGLTPIDETHPLNDMVGTIQRFRVTIDLYTEKLLCKIHLLDIDDKDGYYFIPLWQIIKYCGDDIINLQGVFPLVGSEFHMDCVVGPRRILEDNAWVPALRLPQK